jgi:hypothetical protein
MQLIYRGQVYIVAARSAQPYRKPHALNWRFQSPGEEYSEPAIATYQPPRALNWRYQT